MSEFDGNLMEPTSYWAPPSSPSPRTILAMLNESDDGINPITEIFPQTNVISSRDRTDQPEQRSLGERLAERIGFSLPTLETENISPFAAFFRNSSVSSPVVAISPGFSPSALLQSPNTFYNSSQIIPPPQGTNSGPPEMVETSGEDPAMIFDNDFLHQPLYVDQPPHEGYDEVATEESVYIPSHVEPPVDAPFESHDVVDDESNINLISVEENENYEYEEDDEDGNGYIDEDEVQDDVQDGVQDEVHDIDIIDVDELGDETSSLKRRRRYEASNMIGATRTSKTQRVILQMECEEDHPEDGYRWRKYGQKVVKGNPNPRSYFKCTWVECKVKKHVERGADNDKLVVTTYDGIHNHPTPPVRSRCNTSRPRNRSGGSSATLNHYNRNSGRLGRPPSSFTHREIRPLSSLGQPVNLTQVYMTGLSKLPNLPVNQNPDFMYRPFDEPSFGVVPDGTGIYSGIMHRLFANFGVNF